MINEIMTLQLLDFFLRPSSNSGWPEDINLDFSHHFWHLLVRVQFSETMLDWNLLRVSHAPCQICCVSSDNFLSIFSQKGTHLHYPKRGTVGRGKAAKNNPRCGEKKLDKTRTTTFFGANLIPTIMTYTKEFKIKMK